VTACWMVRAGEYGRFAEAFREQGFVALGWARVGDLTACKDRNAVLSRVQAAYPEFTLGTARMAASQLFRFRQEFAIGDRVVTYDPKARVYFCGIVAGDYTFDPAAEDEVFLNRRVVKWAHETSRDNLSDAAKNTLGAISTIFAIPSDVAGELWLEKPKGRPLPESEADELGTEANAQSVDGQARIAVSDRIARLDAMQMQDLVAGLLRAMGYKTMVSTPGPDRGKDILASPDGLGLVAPRIFVEVKHRSRQRIDAPDIRSFLGGRRAGDCGLYVSTGGFTREARYEAERAGIALSLIDFERLVDLVLEHYSRFDEEARQILPLKMLYWPLN
jgi:restriction system protein